VVEQIKRENQCLDGTLNRYSDKCLNIIRTLETFHIRHIPGEENRKVNALAQQASGFEIKMGLFIIERK
jgi:hypothetical protein